MSKALLRVLVVCLGCLTTASAQDLADPLDRLVAAGWVYKSFDEAVGQIEERTGFKVSCAKGLAAFMNTIWMKQSTTGYPGSVTTVRGFLDQLCGTISLKWSFDPAGNVVAVEPAWKTADPRTTVALLQAVWRPDDEAGCARDTAWQTAFNALLSHPANYQRAWTVRQKSAFQEFRLGFAFPARPLLMQPVIDKAGTKYFLVMIVQPIQMYPGHGSVGYYWFQDDGTLVGAGLMNTGHRCAVVGAAVAKGFGPNAGKPSELQMNLKMNLDSLYLARYSLGATGLELTSLVGPRGEEHDPSGMSVGQNLMEPDPK